MRKKTIKCIKVENNRGKIGVLLEMDSKGRIVIPKEIREKYKGCKFWIEEIDGKIILDPIKIE